MDEKNLRSPDELQAKLKNLQQAAGHQQNPDAADAKSSGVEITVASQRDAYDLVACRTLLEEQGIPAKLVGRGFQQIVVVPRDHSSGAIDLIAKHRDELLRTNPLNAGDYVVGIVAWALGWGLALPSFSFWFLREAPVEFKIVAITIIFVASLLLGGFLGYLRCCAIANRKRS